MNAHLTSLGSAIRDARQAKGLKQHHVAKALEVTIQAVSQWERDETAPSSINMIKLSWLLSIEAMPHFIFDLAELEPVQPHHKVLPDKETRDGEVRTAIDPSRVSELREQVEEINDLLHALDKVGDGIGGSDGYAVSAVALQAKMIADNVLCSLAVMEGNQ